MDIHPTVRMPGLMELRLGILCNVQAHFIWTHIPLGMAWPQWDACFPQVAVSDAPPQCRGRGARRPFFAQWVGLEKQTPMASHISYARIHSVELLTPSGYPAHFQGNFDVSNYRGLGSDRSIPGFNSHTEEKRADNRLELPLGWRQCAKLSELHVCLPLFFPLRAF